MTRFRLLLTIIIIIGNLIPGWQLLHAQTDKWTGKSIFDRWEAQDLLQAELITDLVEIKTNDRLNEYMPATFTYTTEDGHKESYEIKLRPRGRFRRSKCEFPPLKLNFDEDDLEANGYLYYDNYKLVNYCLESDEGKDYVLREYLVYKMYEELTPLSFRSVLVELTFRDENQQLEPFTWFTIILESTNQLEDRLKSEEYEGYNLPVEEVQRRHYQRMACYMFMVGNTDWDLSMMRNIKLFSPESGEKYIPVPYDFDFCGIVGAPYASPATHLPIKTVKDRIFLGQKLDIGEAQELMNQLRSKEKVFLNMIDGFDQLSNSSKKDMKRYVKAFFNHMEDHPNDFFEHVLPYHIR